MRPTTPERRGCLHLVDVREHDGTLSRIGGYAALYNVETVIGDWFRERIAPGAFDVAVTRDDVRALFNHNPDLILGRTSRGTLRLVADATGLAYEIDLDLEDPDAQRVLRKVRRGDVSQSSFGFLVTAEDWPKPVEAGKLPLRIIRAVELFDVSPVTFPAYPDTSVAARDAAATLRASTIPAQATRGVSPLSRRLSASLEYRA
jgi:hypothetical protein